MHTRHQQQLGDVAGKQVLQRLADVVVDAPALLDGGDDRGEIVVGDDHVRASLVTSVPFDAHRDADVRRL